MPLYDFLCNECGNKFESISKPYEPVECQHCKAQGAKQVFAGSSIQYKIKGENSCSTPKRLKMENLRVN